MRYRWRSFSIFSRPLFLTKTRSGTHTSSPPADLTRTKGRKDTRAKTTMCVVDKVLLVEPRAIGGSVIALLKRILPFSHDVDVRESQCAELNGRIRLRSATTERSIALGSTRWQVDPVAGKRRRLGLLVIASHWCARDFSGGEGGRCARRCAGVWREIGVARNA